MIEFGGVIYYLDIEALDKAITSKLGKPTDKVSMTEHKEVIGPDNNPLGTETTTTTNLRGKEIDIPKYEVIRMMIETIIDYDFDEEDTSLGADRALDKTSLSYKLAFNTLYHYGILKEKE